MELLPLTLAPLDTPFVPLRATRDAGKNHPEYRRCIEGFVVSSAERVIFSSQAGN